MTAATLAVALPGLLGAPLLAALPGHRTAAIGKILVCAMMFLAALHLATVADAPGTPLALLTSLVGLTTAWSDGLHPPPAEGWASRLHPAGFVALLGLLHAALLSDDALLRWVFLELATLAEVAMVMLAATDEAVAAGRRMLLQCGTALLLALFGLLLLHQDAPGLQTLAMIFLLTGYGTRAGLAPLYRWLPAAQAAGSAPVLSGLAGNVALLELLRLRVTLGAPAAGLMSAWLLTVGLASLLLAAARMPSQANTKRLLGLSSLQHNGLIAIAFGLANPVGLLHMVLHTLVKSASLQLTGAPTRRHRLWTLSLAATLAGLAGLPPFGVYSSEFLLLGNFAHTDWWLLPPLLAGLMLGAWALLSRLTTLWSKAPVADRAPVTASPILLAGVWINLLLAIVLGLWTPAAVWALLRQAAGT